MGIGAAAVSGNIFAPFATVTELLNVGILIPVRLWQKNGALAQPRFTPQSERRPRLLDAPSLQALAIRYVGRYATTQAKLRSYLMRKIGERGWDGDGPPPVDAIVEKCVTAGYVDDQAFAEAKSRSLLRQGYGHHRVASALHMSGIARDVSDALRPDADSAFASAENYARKRRIGKFGAYAADQKLAQRQFAAMLRAGHSAELARYFVRTVPETDTDDAF